MHTHPICMSQRRQRWEQHATHVKASAVSGIDAPQHHIAEVSGALRTTPCSSSRGLA